MGISPRLKKIAEHVSKGYIVADIGTDHGYVPIYLLKNNYATRVIAVDLSEGSLKKAEENSVRYGVDGLMECRLSDGFEKIKPGEIQCAVISGMGGILMVKILSAHLEVVHMLKELVLSPHRDVQLVKDYLNEINFSIVCEEEFIDKNKRYHILKAISLS